MQRQSDCIQLPHLNESETSTLTHCHEEQKRCSSLIENVARRDMLAIRLD